MATLFQDNFKRALMAGEMDLDTDDIRAILVMTNTTADTQNNVGTISGFTTLGESNATGYARIDMTGLTITQDNVNNRSEFTFTALSWTGLGGDATNDYQGIIVYKHVTNDADSIPLAFLEFTNQPVTSAATQVDVASPAEGAIRIT